MSKQQYAWLQALSLVILQQHDEDDQGDPLSLEMMDVFAVCGRLAKHDRQAANEELAAALILVLIYAWNYAKFSAKSVNPAPDFCKIVAAPIFGTLVCIPHEIRARRALALLNTLCQNDHLPTNGIGQPA